MYFWCEHPLVNTQLSNLKHDFRGINSDNQSVRYSHSPLAKTLRSGQYARHGWPFTTDATNCGDTQGAKLFTNFGFDPVKGV